MERKTPEQYIPDIEDPDGDGDRLFTIMSGLRITSGRGVGKTFGEVCAPWQEKWIRALGAGSSLGEVDEALLLIAKKNGKTAMSGLLLVAWCLCFPEPKGSIILLGATRDQAALAFDAAASAIEDDNELLGIFHVKRYSHQIEHLPTSSIIRTVALENAATTGSMASFYLVDELHLCGKTVRGTQVIKQLSSGSAMRERAMGIYISTTPVHGELPAGLYASMVNRARRILDGTSKSKERLMPVIFEHPKKIPHSDVSHWWRSNPNMDVTITQNWLEREYNLSKEDPDSSALGHFLSQHLQIVTAEVIGIERWIPLQVWDAIADESLTIDDLKTRCHNIWVGVDMGGRDDPSCMVALGYDDSAGVYLLWSRQWLHVDGYNRRRKFAPYDEFIDSGELVVFSSEGEDVDLMLDSLHDIRELVACVGYDPYHFRHVAKQLEADGYVTKPVKQGVRMTPDILSTERAIYEGKIVHPGGPLLRWNFNNTTLVEVNQAVRLGKPADTGRTLKIDGTICTVMAYSVAMENDMIDLDGVIG